MRVFETKPVETQKPLGKIDSKRFFVSKQILILTNTLDLIEVFRAILTTEATKTFRTHGF